ncbi:hypothetical protein [Timonella sp. A28]|uniref:hypothetical protein n=1 Tax=Timonella sp. A28 TaxID=3442640 RepID=UPI003EBB67CD
MDTRYYAQVTQLMRRKGIDDERITQTLNDIKGWEKSHPHDDLTEHFGRPKDLTADLPKGDTIQAPQKILATTIAIAIGLILIHIILGIFGTIVVPLLPLPLWSVAVLAVGSIAYLNAGKSLPEAFRAL